MPQYTREQIYEAMRRADRAGDADAVRALASQLRSMEQPQRSGFSRARTVEREEPRRQEPQQESRVVTYARELARPIGSAVEGAGDLIGIVANPIGQALYNIAGYGGQQYDAGQIMREASGLPRMTSDIAHEGVAAATGGFGFAGGARAVANQLPRAGNAAVQGTRNALQAIGATPGRDAAASAAAGATMSATEDMGPGVQIPASLAAGYLGFRAAGAPARLSRPLPSNTPEAQAIRFGEQNNVPVMTTDVRPPQGFVGNVTRATGERIPFAGTGGPRLRQQQGRERLVKELADDYGVGNNNGDYLAAVAENLSQTRSARLSALTAQKNRVIDSVQAPFTNAPNTTRAISRAVRELRDIDEQEFAPVIERLQRFGERLNSGNLSLRQVEEQRRLLGDLFQDPNLASIRGRGQQAINSIYGPLREDMGQFIAQNAGRGQATAWRRANNELSAMAGELDASTFRNVLSNADATPENVSKLLFSRKPSDVRRLMENLDNTGRRNARSAIVHEILRRSGSDAELRNISPDRVVNTMRSMGRTIGAAFDGPEAARLDGLERFLDMTRRAQQASAAPPTGVQNAPPIFAAVLTDLMGGLGAATASATIMGGLARAYESAPVRNALLRLGRQQPNSQAAQRSAVQVLRVMESQGFLNAANDNAMAVGSSVAQDDQN